MKRILFLIHDLSYGGAERVLVNLANGLDKSKYDVFVQTLFDVGVNKQYLNNDVHYIPGAKKVFSGNATLMKLLSPKALAKIVIKEKYDLVVSFLEGPCSRIVSGYSGKKAAWIHIEHNSEDSLAKNFRSFDEMKKCYDSFDSISCVADTVRENFLKLSKTTANCVTVYNVNNTDDIISKSAEEQETIIKTEDCVNLISVGRLINNHKGFDRLVKVHKRLLDDGINNKLYILGEGPDKENLIELIEKLGVKESCFLLGFQDNPYKYIKAADLFVCSSHKEGFSTAVTEALVLGVPVVSTDVSGTYELLGNNNDFGIVTANSEDGIYFGIKEMLNKDNLENYKKLANIRGESFKSEITLKENEKLFDELMR